MSAKHSLLALLYQYPTHGYELGKRLSLVIGTGREVKAGQIAKILTRLKDAGLVDCEVGKSHKAPPRKVYNITRAGIQELTRWYLTPEIRDYRLGGSSYIKFIFSLEPVMNFC